MRIKSNNDINVIWLILLRFINLITHIILYYIITIRNVY